MFTKYYLVADGGDGSSSIQWFDEKPDLEALQDEDPETYNQNDYVGEISSASEIKVR